MRRLAWLFFLPLVACGETPGPEDAGSDAGDRDAGLVEDDGGVVPGDAGPEGRDAGPPPPPPPIGALPRFGPDPSQCPPTAADRGADAVHVCDCAEGADAACVPGDDAAAGTADAPRRSLAAAATAFATGRVVALCRGGSWTPPDETSLDASGCSSGAPCTITDYGSADRPAPLVTHPNGGANGLSFDPRSDTAAWRGIHLSNLHLRKLGDGSGGFGVFFFRDVGDVEMRCLEVEGYAIGVHLASNGRPSGDVRLFDSSIHGNGMQGWLGGASRTVIERNRFDDNGYFEASNRNHNVYLSGSRDGSVVRGNWLTRSAVDATGQCVGASLIAHNGVSVDLLVEGNLVEEENAHPGCWGINVDAAGSTTESHTRATIRGNVLRDVGNVGIGIASCIDCVVENNVVVQTRVGGAIGIAVPNRPTTPPDADLTRATVRNNTVVYSGAAAAGGRAYYVGERGDGYVVTNNVAYFAPPLTGDVCFELDLAPSAYARIESNACFGATFDRGATGLDPSPLTADPAFAAYPDDLRPGVGSPLRDSGTTASASATDLLGIDRGGSPDRGAYEGE